MNQHDAEKMANLLHHEGLRPAADAVGADVVVVHTCSVRERAEQRLYSELGVLCALKQQRPDLILGVGGCVAQQEADGLLARFPGIDFVFGSQNLRSLPAMIRAAGEGARSLRVDYEESDARFDLPERHPDFGPRSPGRAFVTVMEGCDLFCAYCVVPRTRGREISRPANSILEEVRELASKGMVEVTLLGQTVNAYGRPRPGRAPGEVSFAELIRRLAKLPGIERIRFTSPHPLFMTPELEACYAEVSELCPHLHLPVQSGSDRVLERMGRRYTRARYLEIVAGLRRARPGLALTTDLIVGFPGETPEDFEATLSLVREVAFVDSYAFKYSPRPETPAVRRGLSPVDPERAQARLERLQRLQAELTERAHAARLGSLTRVLVEGASRHGGGQQTGRCPEHRIVNFTAPQPVPAGVFAEVRITSVTPHSLLGEATAQRAGENLEQLQAPRGPAPRELQLPVV